MRAIPGLVSSCLVLATAAVAEDAVPRPTIQGLRPVATPVPLDAFDCDGTIRWEQLPNGASVLSSQEDACYPFTSEVADDFVGNGADVFGVGWWGSYWNGTPLPPDGFTIRVYADDTGVPGDLIHEDATTEYNETVWDPNGYCSQFDAFRAFDDVRYHLVVQATLCFPPQWGWATGDGNGEEGHFRGELFGYFDWVPLSVPFLVPYDMAVVYYTGGSGTPVADTTWSGIKAHYHYR